MPPEVVDPEGDWSGVAGVPGGQFFQPSASLRLCVSLKGSAVDECKTSPGIVFPMNFHFPPPGYALSNGE